MENFKFEKKQYKTPNHPSAIVCFFFNVYPAGAVTSLRSNRVATLNNKVTLREKMDSEFN